MFIKTPVDAVGTKRFEGKSQSPSKMMRFVLLLAAVVQPAYGLFKAPAATVPKLGTNTRGRVVRE